MVRDAPAVDNRHWPYDPYDPYARRQPGDDDGWVVAGDEPNGWAPSGNGRQAWETPRNGHTGAPPRYGGRPPAESRNNGYPPPGRSYPAYPPATPPSQPGAGYRYGPPAAPRQYQPAARARPQPPPVPSRVGDPDDEPRPPTATALVWAIGVFVVPMLLYLAWAFTRSGVAPAGCVDASGAPCPPPRVEAAENLLGVLPAITGAFVLSLLFTVVLRRIATSWRAASVGLAASVIGAGIATVIAAALG